jgi:hypothetical protein
MKYQQTLPRTPGLDRPPTEPPYDNGTHSFPLRVLTIGERDEIVDLQNNPPADPYFPVNRLPSLTGSTMLGGFRSCHTLRK